MFSVDNKMQVKDCEVGDIIEIAIQDGYLEDIRFSRNTVKVTVLSKDISYIRVAWKDDLKLKNNLEKKDLCLQFKADRNKFEYASHFNKAAYCKLISRPKTSRSIPVILGAMLLFSSQFSKSIKQETLNAITSF